MEQDPWDQVPCRDGVAGIAIAVTWDTALHRPGFRHIGALDTVPILDPASDLTGVSEGASVQAEAAAWVMADPLAVAEATAMAMGGEALPEDGGNHC